LDSNSDLLGRNAERWRNFCPVPASRCQIACSQTRRAHHASARSQAVAARLLCGWVATDPLKKITDPAEADPANTAALKEYDFTDGVLASYKRGDETLSLHALRFHDASGAFGAYSFYRQNGCPKKTSAPAQPQTTIAFCSGSGILLSMQLSPTSAPCPARNCVNWPAICPSPTERGHGASHSADLPHGSLDGQTNALCRRAIGLCWRGRSAAPEIVGFDRGAEAVTANYSLRSGPATLTIVDYPTPQIAMAQEARIRAYVKAGSQAQPAWPKPLVDSDQASLEVRRSGPLVALVSGDAIPEESHNLLATVHFDANLMSIPSPLSRRSARPANCSWESPRCASSAPAPPFCLDSFLAAEGLSTAWRAQADFFCGMKRSSPAPPAGLKESRSLRAIQRPHLKGNPCLKLWKTGDKPQETP